MKAPALASSALMVLALAACGPLPEPFRHEEVSPLVSDPRILSSVRVLPVAGYPGLDAAMVQALDDQQDIIAFSGPTDASAILLFGRIVDGKLVWTLTGADGQVLGTPSEPAGNPTDNPATLRAIAQAGAALVGQTLRGVDLGPAAASGIAPSVAMAGIDAPDADEAALLSDAMAEAMQAQGLTVGQNAPEDTIGGEMKVSPAAPGQDSVGVAWTIRDKSGKVLATVSQSSPVEDTALKTDFADMARAIANAAAPGLADIIRHAQSSPPATPD